MSGELDEVLSEMEEEWDKKIKVTIKVLKKLSDINQKRIDELKEKINDYSLEE